LLIKKYLPGSNSYLSLLLASFFLIPFLFQNRYIYDFPILFLFSLAFFLLSKNKYGSYLILFLFASLTKETSLFLIFFYTLRCKKLPKKKYLLILFVQLVIYGITRLTLLIIFRNNPGSIVHYYLVDHINVYLSNPVGALFLFLCIVGIIIFCFTDKSDNNGLYRDTIVTIGCPLLILYLLFGYPFEIRVFLEVFPIVSLCLTSKLMFLFKHTLAYRKLQNQSF